MNTDATARVKPNFIFLLVNQTSSNSISYLEVCENKSLPHNGVEEHSYESILMWSIVVSAILVSELHVILQRNQNSPRSNFPLASLTKNVGTKNAQQEDREQNADIAQRDGSHLDACRFRSCLGGKHRLAIWTFIQLTHHCIHVRIRNGQVL